uniref:Family with sequence similarity 92 member A1 n=1 Tax=Sparus aurata TaxID=8175 RepID=A0A671X3C0_SPAAU
FMTSLPGGRDIDRCCEMTLRDVQVKSMEQTVKHAEKYLGEICSLLASYTRKTAKLRDKADLLVAQLFDFSRTEDPEVQIGLRNLAEDLAMVQDYRQAQVERLETRVVSPLKAYGDVVKSKRADLKKFNTDLNRELKELQKVEKIRLRNPADRQSIAEVNAQKASNNAQRSIRQLEETITDFQRQKLEDIKVNFITVEMLFHAKALEVYTRTYDNLETMNTQKDLEVQPMPMIQFLHMTALLLYLSNVHVVHIVILAKEVMFSPVSVFVCWLVGLSVRLHKNY